MDRSLAPMRPSRALQETSHIVFVTSPRNLSRGRGTIDNVDVSLVCCDILDMPDVIAIQILRQRALFAFFFFFYPSAARHSLRS